MIRQRTSSGAPWEERYGYSRALRVGDLVFVAGTSATGSDGQPVAVGDPHGQTLFILRKIERRSPTWAPRLPTWCAPATT